MKKRKVQQHGLRDTEVLARDITSVLSTLEALVANLRFFADTGRHVRSVHAAEELLRALHQDFPELISEMNPFWDFASSSITRDPTAAGITISLQKISGNVSTQLGMKAGATLKDLFEAVCILESCDYRSISFLMNGDPMLHSRGETLLSECGIVNATVLTLIRRVLPMVLTASFDGTAKILDSLTGECKQTLTGHGERVMLAVFSAD